MTPSEVTGGAPSAAAEDAPSTAGYHATLDQVALIARHAAGEGDPARVSRRVFDRARHELDLEEEVPTPQGLEHRYGQKFVALLRQALAPVSARVAMIGPDRSGQVQADFPDRLMVLALKACERALGVVPTPGDFDTWAAEFTKEREQAGLSPNPLPHSTRFIKRYGSWPDGLHAAGLIDDPAAHRARRATPPPLAETLDKCIDELGVLPSGSLLFKWAKRRGISVSQADTRNAGVAYDACRAKREAEGKWTPEKRTPVSKAPALDDLPEINDEASSRREDWTLEKIVDAMRWYLEQYVSPGQPPRQKHYGACVAKNNADSRNTKMPAKSTVQKATLPDGTRLGFQDVVALAEAHR